ncbi:MAG TPA: hypothetical protein VJT16_18700 [Streptosporangiaceae bacterium]|nr:hypothetical protein [Streptosporangiaceae bacterium]
MFYLLPDSASRSPIETRAHPVCRRKGLRAVRAGLAGLADLVLAFSSLGRLVASCSS